MSEKMRWRFEGKGDREIFDRLVDQLGAVAKEYGLKLEADAETQKGRVHRRGAIDVRFAVAHSALDADVDFGMLLPRSIRDKVRSELDRRLGSLFV